MEFSDYPITNKNILGALLVSTYPLFQRFVEILFDQILHGQAYQRLGGGEHCQNCYHCHITLN